MRTRSITVWCSARRRGTSANSGAALPMTMRLGMREHLVDGRHHEARDVRDVVQDVVAVGAVDARRGSRCGRRRAGRSPCRSGARSSSTIGLSRRSSVPALKVKPRMPTLRLPFSITACTPRSICSWLRGRIALRIGSVQIERLRLVQQRAHVLRQAGAAEGEARLQVVRREVELRVLAEDVHHLVAVDAERLAEVADLVGEGHLQRVPGVVGVLHHLGGLDVGADQRPGHARVERGEQIAARAARLRRSPSSADGSSRAPRCLRAGTRG